MIRLFLTALVLAFPAQAHAADKALILSDDEQTALRRVLDVATKAEGLQIAQTTLFLLNKLNSAPVVTSEPRPEDPKQ